MQPLTFLSSYRYLVLAVVCGFVVVVGDARGVRAQESREQRLEREVDQLKQRLRAVEGELGRSDVPAAEEAGSGEADPRAGEANSAIDLTPFWSREALDTPGALRGIYDKPFLMSVWRQLRLGGYTELEYHSFEDGILGVPEGFRMHRTNLFLFSQLSDRVHFGSEIEFETEFDGVEVENDIEVALEMAFIDWVIFEEFKIRGGVLLPPLGRINVNHDGPVRELTERPLVSTFVIPTTLSEAGIGPHGNFEIHDGLTVGYEVYAVNGFNLLAADGELSVDVVDSERVLREGRTSIGGDINGGIASTGRIGVQILDRVEAGGSWHVGTYDEEGDNVLSLVAGDLAIVQPISWVELGIEGEIAVADFERNTFARTAGVPDRFWGYYVQGSVGGMPDVLREVVPYLFDDEGCRFTAVLRYDHVDLDGDTGAVIEPGFNFRPTSDTVFKFSYRFTHKSIGLRDVPGRRDWDDDGFVFSLTSYF